MILIPFHIAWKMQAMFGNSSSILSVDHTKKFLSAVPFLFHAPFEIGMLFSRSQNLPPRVRHFPRKPHPKGGRLHNGWDPFAAAGDRSVRDTS